MNVIPSAPADVREQIDTSIPLCPLERERLGISGSVPWRTMTSPATCRRAAARIDERR
jgi:hypothetical protein